MCCICIPCTCCGPPVIYSKTPKFCCAPCYQCIAQPVIPGVNDAKIFMSHMKAASDAYYLKHPEIPVSERAIFEEVTDNIGIAATTKKVEGNEVMDRHT